MKYYAALMAMALVINIASYKIGNVTAGAGEAEIEIDYLQADLKNGAQLYDNWLTITHKSPAGNHPLYPADSKKSGKSTWRCKECHGWDYIGNKGRYSKGSHFTGIAGVNHTRTENLAILYKKLTDKSASHDFSTDLTKGEIWDLIRFLREGQQDIALVIDEQGQAIGNVTQGKILYDSKCTSCHGLNGNEIDFKGKKEGIQGVGWLANDNPQESIHKIRWGHPGSDMPSMVTDEGLSEQQAIDILTYSQLLGSK